VTEIEKFIEYIEKSKPFHNTRNLYQGNDDSSFLRKSNLKLYLEQMVVENQLNGGLRFLNFVVGKNGDGYLL
jgi:hypothetical protein